MANILIGDRNHFTTATLSGGSWLADAPLTELQLDDSSRTARSSDALVGSTLLQWDFASAKGVDGLQFTGHNLSTAAQYRLSLGTTAGASDVYSSGWVDVYAVTDDDRNGAEHAVMIPFVSAKSARYGKIEFDDTANAAGFVELTFAWVGEGWRPAHNAVYGLNDSIVDLSKRERTYGGRVIASTRRKFRKVSFSLPVLTHAEGDRVHETQRRLGTTGPVAWFPYPDSTERCQRFGMVGVVSELSPLAYPSYGLRSTGYTIEEL